MIVDQITKVVVCDGCNYIMCKQGGKIPVAVNIGGEEFHFHDAVEHGYPCFEYWLDKIRGMNGVKNKNEEMLRNLKAGAALIDLKESNG